MWRHSLRPISTWMILDPISHSVKPQWCSSKRLNKRRQRGQERIHLISAESNRRLRSGRVPPKKWVMVSYSSREKRLLVLLTVRSQWVCNYTYLKLNFSSLCQARVVKLKLKWMQDRIWATAPWIRATVISILRKNLKLIVDRSTHNRAAMRTTQTPTQSSNNTQIGQCHLF